MAKVPNVNSAGEQELAKVEKQFEAFDANVKELTQDRMNMAPIKETEPQTRLSQSQITNSKDVYLKPVRTIGSREKFNENFREDYNFQKEFVQFIPENKEIIGEKIELWTKPFPGLPAEYWQIPTGKPVWGPRYLAERIVNCKYHRLTMQQTVTTGTDHMGQYYGAMAVDTTVQRLDAIPVNSRKSIFLGASGF